MCSLKGVNQLRQETVTFSVDEDLLNWDEKKKWNIDETIVKQRWELD